MISYKEPITLNSDEICEVHNLFARILSCRNTSVGKTLKENARRVRQILVVKATRQSQAVGVGWQPIDTAPRDGTPVLVWAEPMSSPDIAWHEESGMALRTYTHWMPLPPHPNDSGKEGGE